MQPIHLAIGIMEGIITAAILCFVFKMRPEIIQSTFERAAVKSDVSVKRIVIVIAVITLITGGALSLFVSSNPDGLEWSIEKITGTTELETEHSFIEDTETIQEKMAFMPDYDFRDAEEEGSGIGVSIAGISGSIFTFILAGISVLVISIIKKKRKNKAAVITLNEK